MVTVWSALERPVCENSVACGVCGVPHHQRKVAAREVGPSGVVSRHPYITCVEVRVDRRGDGARSS